MDAVRYSMQSLGMKLCIADNDGLFEPETLNVSAKYSQQLLMGSRSGWGCVSPWLEDGEYATVPQWRNAE